MKHKKRSFTNAALIFVGIVDLLIIIYGFRFSAITGEWPPDGFWVFATAAFAGESIVTAAIKIVEKRHQGDDDGTC